jgi:hypothetical protein
MKRRWEVGLNKWAPVASRRRSTAWSRTTMERVLAAETELGQLTPATVYRFVMGVDNEPVAMPPAELDHLGDPMGLLLRQGRLPLTLNDLLADVDAAGSLPLQQSYLAGEAGQISGSGPLCVIGSTPCWSGGMEDALAQEVEVGAAVHLPLDHFDAVDVALYRA